MKSRIHSLKNSLEIDRPRRWFGDQFSGVSLDRARNLSNSSIWLTKYDCIPSYGGIS